MRLLRHSFTKSIHYDLLSSCTCILINRMASACYKLENVAFSSSQKRSRETELFPIVVIFVLKKIKCIHVTITSGKIGIKLVPLLFWVFFLDKKIFVYMSNSWFYSFILKHKIVVYRPIQINT